jgi:hypothetical protein
VVKFEIDVTKYQMDVAKYEMDVITVSTVWEGCG